QIELVFFDGEEAFGPNITTTDGLYGSKHYASQMVLVPERKRPEWGILLDMVGDKNLNIRAAVQIPNASIQALKKAGEAGHVVDIERVKNKVEMMSRYLLEAANDLEVRSKFGISSQFITDDHIPLNTGAGIPTIDLIDFDYGNYWHTPADTLDKISAESLETVGRVTLLMIEKYLR
ncbi:MAG: M28 family peptidase, partial [Verrucomicrobiales bacterium]|nr:M28 family peptidase [Verrucomicrobiales bacterium]